MFPAKLVAQTAGQSPEEAALTAWKAGCLAAFGNPDKPAVEKYSVQSSETGLAFDIHYHIKTEGMRGEEVKEDRILYNYRLHFPFSTFLTVNFSDDRHYFLFDYASPASARETTVFFRTAQDFDLDSDPQKMIDFQTQVLNEDRPIVESQKPEDLPLDLSEEFHIQADTWSTYFRKALVKMGLGSDLVR